VKAIALPLKKYPSASKKQINKIKTISIKWVYSPVPCVLIIVGIFTIPQTTLKINQIIDPLAERLCDFFHIGEGDVFLRTFNHPDISAVYLRQLSKALLRDAPFEPFVTDASAKLYEYFLVHIYTKKCRYLLTMVLHTIVSRSE